MNKINKDKIFIVDTEYNDDEELVVKPIDMKYVDLAPGINPMFPLHPFCLYIPSSRGSGKTTLIVYLITHPYLRFFNRIYIFSPTAKDDIAFKKIKLDESRIFTSYSDLAFSSVVEEIKSFEDERSLIIVDDMTGTSIMTKNNALTQFIFRHRHIPNDYVGTSIIIASHQYKAVSPNLRNNFTDIIIFKSFSDKELEVIAEDNKGKMTFNDFYSLFEMATKETEKSKHNFFYIKRKMPLELRFRRNFNLIFKIDYIDQNKIEDDVEEEEELEII
jgi:hypothetical protein